MFLSIYIVAKPGGLRLHAWGGLLTFSFTQGKKITDGTSDMSCFILASNVSLGHISASASAAVFLASLGLYAKFEKGHGVTQSTLAELYQPSTFYLRVETYQVENFGHTL